MFLIAFRIVIALAVAYLFGLIVSWLVSFFKNSGGGDWGKGNDEPASPLPPDSGETPHHKTRKKRLVEVDESYYLEEFDLNPKQK